MVQLLSTVLLSVISQAVRKHRSVGKGMITRGSAADFATSEDQSEPEILIF